MPAAVTSSSQLPAWKRLGLKLKYASDTDQTIHPTKDTNISLPVSTQREKPKRKREAEDKDLAQVKKSKKAPSESEDLSHPTPGTPQLRRRKSVAFTPETKVEDGDSIKQLFGAWVEEQKSKDPSFGASRDSQPAFAEPQPSKVEETVDPTPGLTESEQRVKRVKKAKPIKAPEKPASNQKKTSIEPALSYLDQFCHSKDTWKFNKIHQINLLKNAFDISLIPSDKIEQLYTYIGGLKGQARKNLRDAALSIKTKDQNDGEKGFPKTMPDTTKSQREYEIVINGYVAALPGDDAPPDLKSEEDVLTSQPDVSMKERVARRMRAERILADLANNGGDEEIREVVTEASSTKSKEVEEHLSINGGKTTRKRKQRRMEDINDSSSSSEDSNSSDDEDSNDDRGTAKDSPDSDSTSSSSDSSSSDSESDLEEESEESSEEESSDSD